MNITHSAFAILLLSSSMVSAETQYPASDFQPKVVYQDPEYKHSGTSTTTSSSARPSTSSATDSQYPAANFQPKVLYNDPDYKHTQASAAASASAQKSTGGSSSESSDGGKQEESSSNYLIGLIVLAFVGVVLFRKKSQSETKAAASGHGDYRASSSGLTGVAKYINRKAGTGVSRYLEKQVKSAAASSAATGVAKYMAKQSEAAKTSASQAATGVEKYMRNRG